MNDQIICFYHEAAVPLLLKRSEKRLQLHRHRLMKWALYPSQRLRRSRPAACQPPYRVARAEFSRLHAEPTRTQQNREIRLKFTLYSTVVNYKH